MEAISDKNRTFALDLWGFGDSDKSKVRYRIEDYVDLVNKFVENRGMDDVPLTLIGHALGAAVMLEYANRYPERVSKVMAVSLPMSSNCINRKLLDVANSSMVSKVIGWWRQQTIYKEVQREAEKTGKEAISVSLKSVEEMNISNLITNIAQRETKVLAVYGEKDDVIDPGPTRNLDYGLGSVRPIGLSESKHFPMLDEASKFQRLLKDFLEVEDDLSILELKEEWRRRTR